MPKRSTVIALVEDQHHQMFIYRYLRARGFSKHEIRTKPSPLGEGSAEQWVRANYSIEVRAYRTRHAKTALIVVIDADAHTVDERLAQLSQALHQAGSPPVQMNEPVAHLVPKRNVETWILFLNADQVDEEADYKSTSHNWNDLIPAAATTLFQSTRPNAAIPDQCIGSLTRGINELRRLEG